MSIFADRLKRLLAFADYPIPGDRVKIGSRARHVPWRGKIGEVASVWGYEVEVDGEKRSVTSESLTVIADE